MPITPFFAAALAVIYVFMSLRVIRHRFTKKISLGSGDDKGVEIATRIHGNFSEYVPFALLLMWFVEVITSSQSLIIGLGCILVVARIMHSTGMNNMRDYVILRQIGILATFLVILVCAGVLFWNYLPA